MPRPRIVLGLSALVALASAAVVGVALGNAIGAAGLAGGGVLLALAYRSLGSGEPVGRIEPETIEALEPERLEELLRGTSLYLREARTRVSIRPRRGEHEAFSTDVNGIRLGFVPAIVHDQATGAEDPGFTAFVHDGQRWRGPGLPCPGTAEQAVERARRCVSPVDLA